MNRTTESAEVRTFKTVDSMGREAIDTLVDDDSFTYGWFMTLETTKYIDLNPFYVTAFNEGKLVAFTPCFQDAVDQFFTFNTKGVIHLMRTLLKVRSKLHLGQDHVLLCYSPSCSRSKIFVGKGLNEQLLTSDLLKEIDNICKKERVLFSSFLFVSEFDKNLSLSLSNMGYHKYFMGTNYYLDVRWRSFEEYLDSLEHGTRNTIRREMKLCIENGVTIEEMTEFKDLSSSLSALYSNLFAKHNKARQSPYTPAFYEALSGYYAKGDAKLFIAKKNGSMVGFSLNLRHKGTLDAFQTGYDYEQQEKTDFTYFNLVYYFPIKWAIQEGIQKIYYRSAADKVKIRRGCKPERVYSFLKCHNRQINSQIGNYLKIRNKLWRLKDHHSDPANKP